MKVYTIYEPEDNWYLTERAIDNKRKYEILCFDSYEKALNYIKEYYLPSEEVKNIRVKGNIITYYDTVDEMRRKVLIEEMNVR